MKYETRVDLGKLESTKPELASQFKDIADMLDSSDRQTIAPDIAIQGVPSVPSNTVPNFTLDRRHELLQKFEETTNLIRKLPGFEGFLKPLSRDDLSLVAPKHPVVVINVDYRCDALILLHGKVHHLPLPDLRRVSVEAALDIVRAIRETRLDPRMRVLWYHLLGWLWRTTVRPVLQYLGFTTKPTESNWPRIWWVPTGALSQLPLHAAGIHRETSTESALDRVISSYSPSVKAMVFSRQNNASPLSPQTGHTALLTSMGTTPGQNDLPCAETEAKELNDLLQVTMHTTHLEYPFKEDTVKELPGSDIFHFAGHGKADPIDPSQSCLLLQDWHNDPLTVGDLIAMKLHETQPWLAFLSACSTSESQDKKLLDESVHMVSAFQLAGFRNVLGTLWEVSDRHSLDLAKDVYISLEGVIGEEEVVAHALHHAVRKLRDDLNNAAGNPSDEPALPLAQIGLVGGYSEEKMTKLRMAAESMRQLIVIEDEEDDDVDDERLGAKSIRRVLPKGDPLIWSAYIHVGL
ncbi:uncharacterized protein N0V89_001770 [Didymosphaeria variabile]|uniref:CHAT domain-containing protein n=1 Tax=Didymosphaeria variabile TaxID=1932322 RepID=A0A9W8XT79_9PLEO|nr:uncharacterized protein N0V89_001770 [Didymosphaeria variabile]KAJ4357195.1 hypothetical protein N0V89_001770 [Didymosphaeria variabile]